RHQLARSAQSATTDWIEKCPGCAGGPEPGASRCGPGRQIARADLAWKCGSRFVLGLVDPVSVWAASVLFAAFKSIRALCRGLDRYAHSNHPGQAARGKLDRD